MSTTVSGSDDVGGIAGINDSADVRYGADQLLPVPQPQLLQSVSGAADVVLQRTGRVCIVRPEHFDQFLRGNAGFSVQDQIGSQSLKPARTAV